MSDLERERHECKVCSWAVSGPFMSPKMLGKIDTHERLTGHVVEEVDG